MTWPISFLTLIIELEEVCIGGVDCGVLMWQDQQLNLENNACINNVSQV